MSQTEVKADGGTDVAFVITSFGVACWERGIAPAMVHSFCQNWPEDVMLVVVADPECKRFETDIRKLLRPTDIVTFTRTPEREEWLKGHEGFDVGADYRKHLVRWSHKVWAMSEGIKECANVEHMVWLDSDIVTHSKVSHETLRTWLPSGGAEIAYLGRKDWSESETGFIAFKVSEATKRFVADWYALFTDGVLAQSYENYTDAYAFDVIRKQNLLQFDNLTAHVHGRDVFDTSPLAVCLEHVKGPVRKKHYHEAAGDPTAALANSTLDVNNMGISTVNNIDMTSICNNIFKNTKQIRHWVDYCQSSGEEVVLVSAGPSLTREDIMPFVERGVKIVAVKHSLDRLRDWGIKPWACLLLDGRGHVGQFVESPDKDVIYIVASMVDPKVVERLNKYQCKVIGYHAYVGKEITEVIPCGHLMLEGGSATSTRGINVLYTLGFRKINILGIDCCYFEKPDLNARKENGKLKYMEINLSCETWGNKQVTRTFWTEGQFLAQVQEFKRIYFSMEGIELKIFGDGVISWMWKHTKLFNKWKEERQAQSDIVIAASPTLDEFITYTDSIKFREI